MRKIFFIVVSLFFFFACNDLSRENIYDGDYKPVTFNMVGRYSSVYNLGAAEISAFDPGSNTLYVLRGDRTAFDIVNISDPSNPVSTGIQDLSSYGKEPTSIACSKTGIVAVAVLNNEPDRRGKVVFFDAAGSFLADIDVGVHPDMVMFTPDNLKVLVANEGEPSGDYRTDPDGTISIIDISSGVSEIAPGDITELGFKNLNPDKLVGEVRIFGPGSDLSEDIEPEYIAVSPDSLTAYVSCQENNAIAVIDLVTSDIIKVVGLGYKDHSLPGNGLDYSDTDGGIKIETAPLLGMYQPDGVAACELNGKTYILTANEGDSRDYPGYSEEVLVEDLDLDPSRFSRKTAEKLARLKTTSTKGDENGDGLHDKIYTFGARSFSIRDENLNLIWDSGDQFERITARIRPGAFNSNGTYGSFDSRSDDKGPEPESVVTGVVKGHTFAFIGLERVSGIMVYDITEPWEPKFVKWLVTTNPEVNPDVNFAGDLSPEGLLFVNAAESPTGKALLIASFEVSGTVAIFEII